MLIPSIRLARPDDALCIAVLGAQVFLDTYATDGIRPSLAREVLANFSVEATSQVLADASTAVLLAEHDGHLIGFAQTSERRPHELFADASAAELRRLYVQERFTGQGIGKQLLAQAERLLAARGAGTMWLTAWVGNARALAFYPRQGYEELGRTVHEFEGERYENRLFGKRLVDVGSKGSDMSVSPRAE
jgi:GNAT superfamily N-acetyltransferase